MEVVSPETGSVCMYACRVCTCIQSPTPARKAPVLTRTRASLCAWLQHCADAPAYAYRHMLYTLCAHCSSTWQGIVYHQHDRPTDTCSNMHTNHAMYYDLLVAEYYSLSPSRRCMMIFSRFGWRCWSRWRLRQNREPVQPNK